MSLAITNTHTRYPYPSPPPVISFDKNPAKVWDKSNKNEEDKTMEFNAESKIDTSDRSQFKTLGRFAFEDKMAKLKYFPESWNDQLGVRLDCPECKRGGTAGEVKNAIREINRGNRGSCNSYYWHIKKKQFVCPFCNEGLLIRTKIEE